MSRVNTLCGAAVRAGGNAATLVSDGFGAACGSGFVSGGAAARGADFDGRTAGGGGLTTGGGGAVVVVGAAAVCFGKLGTGGGLVRFVVLTGGSCLGSATASAGARLTDAAGGFGLATGGGTGATLASTLGTGLSALAGGADVGAEEARGGVALGSAAIWVPLDFGPISAANDVAGIRVPPRGLRGVDGLLTRFERAVFGLALGVSRCGAFPVVRWVGGRRSDRLSEPMSTNGGRSSGSNPPTRLVRPVCGAKAVSKFTSIAGSPLPPMTIVC